MTDSATSAPMRTAGRVFAWVLGALLLVAVVAAAWVGVRGVLAYRHLEAAQAAASAVRADLSDPAAATRAIGAVAAETAAARSLTGDPVWRAAESLPWLGPQLHALSTVAAAVDDTAGSALTPLAEVASTISLDSFRPQDGRIDLSGFVQIQDAAASGTAGVEAAAAAISGLDRAPLVAPVRAGVDELEKLLDETRTAAGALARASALLPAMLGADGPRDYLVLFQNNAEWRSLGGIPGAMALIHTDGGRLSLAGQESTADFPRYDTSVLPLGEEASLIFGEHPGRWIQNVTQAPDFAVSAALAREMWARQHGGQQVDGVVALDPVTLSYLLRATGPVALPTGDVLTPESTVPLLLNGVYERYERPQDQDDFFAMAAAAVFDALSHGDPDPAALVAALARAGDEHRLLMWSAHEADQSLLADTTLAGGLPVTDADAARFGVYLNDGTGSKMDYYATADIAVEWTSCQASPAGTTGDATATITIANDAPVDVAAIPGYITGGGAFGVPPGVARTLVYVYLPEGFDLAGAELTTGGGFGGGTHEGRRVVSFTVDLAPGQSAAAVITARTTTPGAGTVAVDSTPRLQSPSTVVATCEPA